MTKRPQSASSADPQPNGLEREDKAEIVDRLYDVALDPIRLEKLVDVWEGRVGPMRRDPLDRRLDLDDPAMEAHLDRATIFLDRFEASQVEGGHRSVLDDIPRSAAFVSDGGSQVAAANRAAGVAFGLSDGSAVTDLPFDPADIDALREVIRKVASGKGEKVVTMRIRSLRSDGPVILRISAVQSDGPRPLALVISTELVWPDGFEASVSDAFGLTSAEVEIVRGITLGLPLREIAAARGRSPETVRTQLRSILAKSETHSQSELVRIVLGLMDVSMVPGPGVQALTTPGGLGDIAFHDLQLANGRRLQWLEFGAPDGAPCLFMHMDYGFVRWPVPAERAAQARGIRVIVPVRAGFGRSDPLPDSMDHTLGCTLDYAAVLDHLGLRQVAVISQGADLRFALCLAAMRPGLVTGILGCAAQLPLRNAAQYDRMDKWQRFILANARYAPKVLPFLVKAGFYLARRIGPRAFFAKVNGGSAADMATFARPEVQEALVRGSEVLLGHDMAWQAFARECLGSERDWSDLIHGCKVPVTLLQGEQDPQTPVQTIRELAPHYPDLEVVYLPDAGQLLFFGHWPMVLERLAPILPHSCRP